MGMDKLKEEQVKSLILKGFNEQEISKMLPLIEKKEIKQLTDKPQDLTQTSTNLYSALQKDLSLLVFKEMKKDDRDSAVILNAIKLQAELQEKKLVLNRNIHTTKINKNYIYERDKEIAKLNLPIEEIAKKFNISVLSVKQSTDRYNLNLPEELKELNPTVISETIGLDKKMRLKVLNHAYKNNLKRKEVREMVNKLKNEAR
jgi:hypothetical protein